MFSLPVVVQLEQRATWVRTGLPSAMGTEDSLSVSSKQGEQKSSLCLMFWESSEVSLHLSRRNRRGRGAGEKLEEMGQEMFRETGRKRLEVNIFHRKKTKDTKSKRTFKWKTIKHDNSGVHFHIRIPGSQVLLKQLGFPLSPTVCLKSGHS